MTSDGASVSVLQCADGSYYTGSMRRVVEERFAEHSAGLGGDYTRRRLPVVLIHVEHFQRITDAIAFERQFKGWSRAKKEAFLRSDFDELKMLASRRKRMIGRLRRDAPVLRDAPYGAPQSLTQN